MPSDDRIFIERSIRVAIVAAVSVAVLFSLLFLLKAALTPLAVAFVLAYLFDPLIDRIEARRMKRGAAIFLVLGVLGLGGLVLFVGILPRLLAELAVLAQELPGYLERSLNALIPRFEATTGVRVPTNVAELAERVRSGELRLPLEAMRNLLQQTLSFLTGTLAGVVGLLIVPILAYYALVDFDRLKARALALVPPRQRDYVLEKASLVDELVSSFLRGQLTIAFILGVLYAIGFSVIGIDLAIGVGMVAGLMALIPYLGNIVAVTAASLLSLLKFGVDVHLLLVLAWYGLIQFLEGWILTPRVIGRSVGLHPALVIIALLIGADLLGFVGLLVAVPLAAVAKVFLGEALSAYRQSNLFREGGGP